MLSAAVLMLGVYGVAGSLTCAPTAAPTCSEPFSCGFRCIGTDSYSKYSKPASVESNKPDAEFPSSTSEAQDYLVDAATPAVVIIFLGVLCCLMCCCYNLCNCKRVNMKAGLIGCHPAHCWASGSCRRGAWFVLAIIGIVYGSMLFVALAMNKDTSEGIRQLPSFMSGTANYLEDPMIKALNCSALYPNAIAVSAINMQSSTAVTNCVGNGHSTDVCNGVNESLTIIAEAAYTIQDEINGTSSQSAYATYTGRSSTGSNGVVKLMSDGVQGLKDAASEADTLANTAGDNFQLGANVLLGVLLVTFILATCISTLVAARDDMKHHYCLSSNCMNLMICLFLLLAILCAAYVLVLRLSAGFCDDPFSIMAKNLKSSNSSAPNYYTMCHTYTEAELNATWPWKSPQEKIRESYVTIESLMAPLNVNWTTISGDAALASYILSNTTSTGCVFSGDSGVLGYDGLLKCGTINRFVHTMISGYCEDVFDPLHTLTVCLLIIAISILVANWLEVALRREGANYKQVHPSVELKSMA